MSKIISVATVRPDFKYNTDQIIEAADRLWLQKIGDEETRQRAIKVFKGANIDTRHSVLPLERVFEETSFEEKNNHYIESMVVLGCEVFEKAIEMVGLYLTILII